MKPCKFGAECRFLKKRTCSFWHDAFGPLPHEHKSIPPSSLLPPLDQIPSLSKNTVVFEKIITSETWWTAACAHRPSKTVIYAQNVHGWSGYINDDGIVWFRSKDDALNSLRYTVYILRHDESRGGDHDNHNHYGPSKCSAYHDSTQSCGDDERTVRVEGIAFEETPETVHKFFEVTHSIPDVIDLMSPTYKNSGRSVGYGDVKFGSNESYQKALTLTGKYLGRRFLKISPVKSSDPGGGPRQS